MGSTVSATEFSFLSDIHSCGCFVICAVAAKKNGFAYVSRSGNDLPRPILIFVVAKKNGFACYGRGGNDLPRPILIFVVAKKNGPPAGRHYRAAASILDFSPRLANRCRVFPVYALLFCGPGLVKASFQRPGPQNEISIAFAMLTP